MSQSSRKDILEQLRRQLKQATPVCTHSAPIPAETTLFETLFPSEELSDGTLIEWLTDGDGIGAGSLALAMIADRLRAERTLVIVDANQEFYPPAVVSLGVALETLVVLRPKQSDVLWAIEQTMRCTGVAGVLSRMGHIDDRAYRRLQLAIEHGGGVGMLLRPEKYRGLPSWADVRCVVRPLPGIQGSPSSGQRLQIEVIHSRGRNSGPVLKVELCHETGAVRVVSSVASAEVVPCAS